MPFVSVRLAAATTAGALGLLCLSNAAYACDHCNWGMHDGSDIGGDVGGIGFIERANLFNQNLQPGQTPVNLKGYGGGDPARIGPGGTQQVWLDFSGSVGFTTDMRTQVLAGMQDVYRGFDATFSLSQPSGAFTRLIYDNQGFGGVAREIDFRNLNQSINAFIGTNFNTFNGQSVSQSQKVNYGINVGSHELGHTLGLRHHDSFGAIGQGAPSGTNVPANFLPAYPGPTSGNEFYFNIMSTPAIGGNQSALNFLNGRANLSERSLIKLAFATNGSVDSETAGDNNSLATAQSLPMHRLDDIPNNRPSGTLNADRILPVRAASIEGASISSTTDADTFSAASRATS